MPSAYDVILVMPLADGPAEKENSTKNTTVTELGAVADPGGGGGGVATPPFRPIKNNIINIH